MFICSVELDSKITLLDRDIDKVNSKGKFIALEVVTKLSEAHILIMKYKN